MTQYEGPVTGKSLDTGSLVGAFKFTDIYSNLQPNNYIYDNKASIIYWSYEDRSTYPEYVINPYDRESCQHEVMTYINTLYSVHYSLLDPTTKNLPIDTIQKMKIWEKKPWGSDRK